MLIDDINIDDYIEPSGFVATRYYRNQVKQDNIIGDRTIDRGSMKFKITLKLNLLSEIDYSPLLVALSKKSFDVTFDDANLGTITRTFSCDSIPSPRYLVINGMGYYKGISLSLEEL